MYMSPLTERMRKRKAFADTELESSLFTLPSPSSVTNLSSSYSHLSMLTLPQTMHLSSASDYHTIQQSRMASESDMTEYLPTSTMEGYPLHEHPSSNAPSHKIRIIDDAKLANMSLQNNEPLIYSPSSIQHNSHCTNAKPKLSFSIESIIGIK